MRTVAIVPARGGSKGLARKNLRLIAGMSLVEHAVRQGIDARLVAEVVVSTDDAEIRDVACRAGARVVDRPAALAADDAPTLPVLQHVLQCSAGPAPDIVVTLQPTSPLRTSADIDGAIALLTPDVDSVVSVCVAEHSPFKMYSLVGDQLNPLFQNDARGIPRQRIGVAYRENGAVYVSRASILLKGSLYGNCVRPFIMDEASSVDIDTEADLVVAETLLSMRACKS
jgi:CMP-N,N'-diacetyllegionaminic acid synthase